MFLKYLDPLFKPFRDIKAKMVKVQTVKGNIQVDVNRVKRVGDQGKALAGQAQGYGAQAQGAVAGAQAMQQGQGAPGGPAGPGAAAAPGAINPNPPIKVVGLIFKKKFCTQCNQELDKTWDACPHCLQAAEQAALANKKPLKTVAFMANPSGGGGMQLLGWLVPLDGPAKGELFGLSPQTVIGKDPACNIVLVDGYMSSRHAEIKAEGGVWVLKDLGSTNGTFVNDNRVDKQELVDNDVIAFGKCNVKFKSL